MKLSIKDGFFFGIGLALSTLVISIANGLLFAAVSLIVRTME